MTAAQLHGYFTRAAGLGLRKPIPILLHLVIPEVGVL
jgi:hypothetical protein